MEVAIVGIGTANPVYKQSQTKTAELVATVLQLKPAEKRLLKSIYKATGIEHRHSVLNDYAKIPGEFEFFPNDANDSFPSTAARMKIYQAHALTLALAAIEDCLGARDKSVITHLITVSCTGMYAPGIDIELVQQLNLRSSTKRTCINFMGCYGAFNAIKLANDICKADAQATVLIVCVELCSIHFQKNSNLDNMISNAIFADGAAAFLIQAHPSQQTYLSLTDFHCELIPQTSQEMAWHVADSGFDIVLSSYVPEVIESGIAAFTQTLLNRSGFQLNDIGFFAIHPGGVKILEACEQSLNISAEKNKYSYQVLREFGNMSSATVGFVLKAIWRDLKAQDNGQAIFSCAFGPGLTLESMLLQAHC